MPEEQVKDSQPIHPDGENPILTRRSTLKYIIRGLVILTFLICIYVFSVFNCGKEIRPETHLIPNNFIGEVNIVFNAKDGAKRERLNGSRVYRIPKDGTLKSKFSPNTGWLSNPNGLKFFYSDSIMGNDIELFRVDWPEKVPLDKVNTHSVVIRNFGYVKRNDEVGNQITVLEYEIDTLQNFPHLDHYIDSLRK